MEPSGRPSSVPPTGADLEDLYEHAPCGLLSTLQDGTIVRANQTFLQWIGYSSEELVGRMRLYDVLTPGGRIYHETHYAPMLHMQGSVRELALEFVRSDGQRVSALINAVSRPGADRSAPVVHTSVFPATERRRYEQELLAERKRAQESEARARELSRTLQASLLPPAPSQIPGFDVAAVYRPAGTGDEIGGDFYDVFETKRGDWIAVIGDVSGKGIEAARVTAAARYALRAAAMRSARPRAVLGAVNEVLLSHAFDRFCTVACVRVMRRGDTVRLTVSCAGHPPPVVVTAHGELRTVGEAGSLLGVFDRPQLSDSTIDMARGDAVVLYTDGVTEGRHEREFYGEERMYELLERHRERTAHQIVQAMADEVLLFQRGMPRDDIAVLVLRRLERP